MPTVADSLPFSCVHVMLAPMTRLFILCTTLLGLLTFSSATAETLLDEDEPIFRSVRLPHGISVELPRSWRVFVGDNKEVLETAGSQALDLSHMTIPTSRALLRATATPADQPASIFVAYQAQSPFTPAQAAELTPAALADYDRDFRQTIEQQMHTQGITLVEWSGARQDRIGDRVVLVSEYLRKNRNAQSVREQINLIPLDHGMVLLSVTYNEHAGESWRAVVMRIRSSCVIESGKQS
jgi:hypothetical protein